MGKTCQKKQHPTTTNSFSLSSKPHSKSYRWKHVWQVGIGGRWINLCPRWHQTVLSLEPIICKPKDGTSIMSKYLHISVIIYRHTKPPEPNIPQGEGKTDLLHSWQNTIEVVKFSFQKSWYIYQKNTNFLKIHKPCCDQFHLRSYFFLLSTSANPENIQLANMMNTHAAVMGIHLSLQVDEDQKLDCAKY